MQAIQEWVERIQPEILLTVGGEDNASSKHFEVGYCGLFCILGFHRFSFVFHVEQGRKCIMQCHAFDFY
jgi:hypothetical protein